MLRVSLLAKFPKTVLKARSLSTLSSDPDTVVARCTHKISTMLEVDSIKVTSLNDDPNGNHISVWCVSKHFEGKSQVQRQRMVYKALWEELQGAVHAVDSIVAKSPSEAGPAK